MLPYMSTKTPATVGPTASPKVMPALIQVMPSVRRAPGTLASHTVLSVMRKGA